VAEHTNSGENVKPIQNRAGPVVYIKKYEELLVNFLFMKPITIAPCFVLSIFLLPSKATLKKDNPVKPKIQVAILLDVSGSMSGLIGQAKTQLWNMVSVMGKAECNNQTPAIEIALYEYGRPTNDKKQGYVKQINGFTSDLDQLSKNLFSLRTDGGDEYCGHVIYSSLGQLDWDTSSSCYKVIFIAGNEDFLQGDIHYAQACDEAKRKKVIVNTIYCGDKNQGIVEHWNLGGECGNGSFSNINQNATEVEIPTPYDTTLLTLNKRLNSTYVHYGERGEENMRLMAFVDETNPYRGNAYAKRVAVKGNRQLYNNGTWDLVDLNNADSTGRGLDNSFIAKLDRKTLPDSLRKKTNKELLEIIKNKSAERAIIQKDIREVYAKREKYITDEKQKSALKNDPTLETEIEKIIREQVKRFNMVIK
jgi:hypothetical protein